MIQFVWHSRTDKTVGTESTHRSTEDRAKKGRDGGQGTREGIS